MTETTSFNLDRVLARVRALVAKAEAPIADGATDAERAAALIEQESARQMADAMMLRYSIDQAKAREATPAAARTKPDIMVLDMGKWNQVFWVSQYLATYIARHTRCICSPLVSWDSARGNYTLKVYGFQADLKFFEILFTTVQLHMLGVLLPKVEKTQSLEENCYRLHAAGYNWLQIAEMYGWRKVDITYITDPSIRDIKVPFRHNDTGDIKPSTQVGSHYKRAYYRAIEAKGEQPLKIAAGTLESFQSAAAQGYLSMINTRLRQIETGRLVGSGLVLKSSMDDVRAMYDADHPKVDLEPYEPCAKCEKAVSGSCREHQVRAGRQISFSAAGYAAGAAHAKTAQLNPAASGASRTALS